MEHAIPTLDNAQFGALPSVRTFSIEEELHILRRRTAQVEALLAMQVRTAHAAVMQSEAANKHNALLWHQVVDLTEKLSRARVELGLARASATVQNERRYHVSAHASLYTSDGARKRRRANGVGEGEGEGKGEGTDAEAERSRYDAAEGIRALSSHPIYTIGSQRVSSHMHAPSSASAPTSAPTSTLVSEPTPARIEQHIKTPQRVALVAPIRSSPLVSAGSSSSSTSTSGQHPLVARPLPCVNFTPQRAMQTDSPARAFAYRLSPEAATATTA